MIRLFFFYFLFLLLFFNVYSFSTCITITSPGLYALDDNISTGQDKCIDIQAQNVTLDCQNYWILGDGSNSMGIIINETLPGFTNVSINNCNLNNFSDNVIHVNQWNQEFISFEHIFIEMPSSSGNSFSVSRAHDSYFNNITIIGGSRFEIGYSDRSNIVNSKFHNISYQFRVNEGNYLYFENLSFYDTTFRFGWSDHSTIRNIYSNNSHDAILIEGGAEINNTFENIFIYNANIGFNIRDTLNSTFNNINIYNSSVYEIRFYGTASGNTFNNSYFGNWSKIYSTNWSQQSNFTFFNINFLEGTQENECFDYLTLNQICLFSPPVEGISLFPFSSYMSIFFLLFSFFLYFV